MVCSTDNFDAFNKTLSYACESGYDVYYNSCCSYGMYIFWNTISWLALCGCCVLCIFMMAQRSRQMRA